MRYFDQFPNIEYAISPTEDVIVKDIFRNLRVKDYAIDDVSAYKSYQIRDGQRPDNVSFDLYGTSNYWWTFFIVNPHLRDGLTAWPMASDALTRYIESKYDGTVITGLRQNAGVPKDTTNIAASNFVIGEIIEGQNSGATAKVIAKNIQMNQVIVKVVGGTFSWAENLVGQTSGDTYVYNTQYTYRVGDYKNAVAEYNQNGNTFYRFDFVLGDDIGLDTISYADMEFLKNEEKERIRYIRPDSITDFADKVKRKYRE